MIRLINTDDGANKFWEGSVAGTIVTVRFGKIGSKGQVNTSDMGHECDAELKLERLVREKLRKGYRHEQEPSAGASEAVAGEADAPPPPSATPATPGPPPTATTSSADAPYPFLFFGAKPAEWHEAANMGHIYELRFAGVPDAQAKRAIAEAFERALFRTVVESPSTLEPWLWSGAWTVFCVGEVSRSTDVHAILFAILQKACRDIHRAYPLLEANYINVRELGSDPWTTWSLARKPTGPAPHPPMKFIRGHFGQREDATAPVPEVDAAFEQARAEVKQRLVSEHEAAWTAAHPAVEGEGLRATVIEDTAPNVSDDGTPAYPEPLATYLAAFDYPRAEHVGDGRYIGSVRYGGSDDRLFLWHESYAKPLELLHGEFTYAVHPDGRRAIAGGTRNGDLYELDLVAGTATYQYSWRKIHWNAVNYTQGNSVVVAAVSSTETMPRSFIYLLARRPSRKTDKAGTETTLEVVDQALCEPNYPVGLSVWGGIIATSVGNHLRTFGTDGLQLKRLGSVPFANKPSPFVRQDRLLVRGASLLYEVKDIQAAYAAAFPGSAANSSPRKGAKKAGLLTTVDRDSLPTDSSLHPAIAAQLAEGDVPVALAEDKAFIFRPATRGWSLHYADTKAIACVADPETQLTRRSDSSAPAFSAAVAARWSRIRLHPNGDRAFYTVPEGWGVFEVALPSGLVEERMRYRWGHGRGKDIWFLNDECFIAITDLFFFFMKRGVDDPLLSEPLRDGSLACTPDGKLVFLAGSGKDSAITVYGVRGSEMRKLSKITAGINPQFRVSGGELYVDCVDGCFALRDFGKLNDTYEKVFGVARDAS
jgi:predicted DNA-binding WGR domain protein